MKKNIGFFLLTISISCFKTVSVAQTTVALFGKVPLINGYSRTIEGETMPYMSLYRDYAKTALLTRCTDGKKAIAWETDPVPENANGKFVYFTWIAAHSSGTSSGIRKFDLYVNDKYALTFITHPQSYPTFWTFGNNDGTRIVFECQKKDAANDSHGMAYLRLPLNLVQKGKAVRLKVIGQNQNSNDWYMTFAYSFKEKMDVKTMPFINKGTGKQPVQVTVLHFGNQAKLDLAIGKTHTTAILKNGFNVLNVPVDTVGHNKELPIHAWIEKGLHIDTSVLQTPITYREINLIHHAHTDIGYSDIQENVIKIHVADIRNALQLIEKTKNYPKESRFKWNIESAWAVENFMNEASAEEKKKFLEAVKNRQIQISATFANILTGLSTPEEMDWIMDYTQRLTQTYQLPVIKTAMMSDVPGMSCSMVPALAKAGVRYFSDGPNYVKGMPDKGDRIGHTLTALGDKPFWWKSSSGKDSILMWVAAKGYSSWHGYAQGDVFERGEQQIADYLNELQQSSYPYSMVQWRYNVVSDNGPTDSTIARYVKQWNETYDCPKLVLAEATDMFERFEQQYGKVIPVMKGDFTPYWEDGAYSTAKEEAMVRETSEKLTLLQSFAKQTGQTIDSEMLYRAHRGVVMFHEHTWGAYNSISEPDKPFVTHQWLYKKAFADSAKYYTDKIAASILAQDAQGLAVTVVNTLHWPRGGLVTIPVAPSCKACNVLIDDAGRKIPIQKNENGYFSFNAELIPALGQKKYRLSVDHALSTGALNHDVNWHVNTNTGAFDQLTVAGNELVNPGKYGGLLNGIYREGTENDDLSLSANPRVGNQTDGPVYQMQTILASLKGTNGITYQIKHVNNRDEICLSVTIDKKAIRNKESLHLAFPFAIEQPVVYIGTDSGYYTPESGTLPGANKDFFCVQRWLAIAGKNGCIEMVSPQGALFEVGRLINESRNYHGYKKWEDTATSSATVMLYAMNNYWHTNYKADQDGKVRFDIYIRYRKNFNAEDANRFGYEQTQPLVGRLMR